MDNYNEYLIEDTLTNIAKRKIKSFYIELFAKELRIDVATALIFLGKFATVSNKIKIKYEVRCLPCLAVIKVYENIEDIEIGSLIECETCVDDENEINLELSNIYIKYYINDDWFDYVRQKQIAKKNEIGSVLNNPPCTTPTLINNIENGSLSLQNLKDMNILDAVLKEGRINIYINNGNAGSMGEKSSTFDAKFNEKENIYDRKLYQ